jgi:hypothetical protein
VSISGVVQVGGEDFTWVGTTLTFVVAPPNGTRIQVRYTRAIPPADLASAVAAAEADRVATAADRVQTGLDRIATAADVVSAEADRVATAADAAATAADRVQTGSDAASTAADVVSAEAALAAALALTPASAYSLAAIAETSPGVGGASYPAAVKAVQIQHREPSYALPSTLRGKPFKIARLSKADIDSAGVYPARAVVRTADRFMPDGSTDATNGGYWVIADAVLCAEMFGQLHLNNTETTATLRAFHEMAYWTGRPGRWSGDAYTINGPLLDNNSRATGSLHITRDGPVTVTVAGGTTPMTAVIFARTTAISSITLDGAPMEINAATLAACGVQIGHDGGGSYANAGGHCKVRSITAKNLLAASGESAAAITIIGPYETYDVEDNHANNVNRAPNGLPIGGECKGIAVSEAKRACVMRRCTATNIYAQDDRDADAFAIFGPLASGTGYALGPLAGFEYCVASGAQGRTIKSQTAHTRVTELQASRGNSISGAVEIDAQYGSLEVDGAAVTITGAVGASYSVLAPQGQRPSPVPLYSRIERVSVASAVILPRMVAATRGANYARHSIFFANNSGSRTDDPAASLWDRGVIEISLTDARAASTLLDINAVDNVFPTLRPMYTYTGDNGTDPSDKLALRGHGNRNLLTVNGGGQAFLASISGTTISKFAAYTPGINPGFHQVFETWYVDWDTIQPGAVYDVNLATFTQANGPSGLPSSGYARVTTGQGERGWYTHFERQIEVLTTGQVFRKTLSNWNPSAPMSKGAAVADITATATSGSLPTANGSITIADAAAPTVLELLEYCRELEATQEALTASLRAAGVIAT